MKKDSTIIVLAIIGGLCIFGSGMALGESMRPTCTKVYVNTKSLDKALDKSNIQLTEEQTKTLISNVEKAKKK
jgi:hypothetical protein